MGTRIPRAWETSWAQDATRTEKERPADVFQYGEDEAARVAAVKSGAANPDGCSREVPEAPARGPVAEFREYRYLPKGDDFEPVEAPYRAGCPGRVRDIFDTMTDQVGRRGGPPPFTLRQVDAGRAYGALHQRVQSAGVKCSSVFDTRGGGRGRVDFMDAYMRDVERLGLFHEAIGDGTAKDIRSKRSVLHGGTLVGEVELRAIGRQVITVRALVDQVCIYESSLSDVLKVHGWRPTGKNRKTLRAALCAALGRMQVI